MSEHRGAERSLYGVLQQPEHAGARALLEGLLGDVRRTYESICEECNAAGLFDSIKVLVPQDLSRYRERKFRQESRARAIALMEGDAGVLLEAAQNNPSGLCARYVRKALAEEMAARLEEDADSLDLVELSRETSRQALVEQRDRKLTIEGEKLELERKRLELKERQAAIERDRFGIAAETYKLILGWLAREEPRIADALTRRSDELLAAVEESLAVGE